MLQITRIGNSFAVRFQTDPGLTVFVTSVNLTDAIERARLNVEIVSAKTPETIMMFEKELADLRNELTP